MKSNRVLATIVGSSGALVLASTGVLTAIWPHVTATVSEATHAIAYACQAVLADLSHSQVLLAVLGFFVIAGLIAWLGYTFVHFFRLSRPAKLPSIAVPVAVLSIAADAGLDPSWVSVVRSDRAYAMTVGVRWPEVVLSTAALRALTRIQLQAVLEHEAHHVQQREPLRRLLLSVALLWVPFRFLRRNLKESYIAASEIEADARVRNQYVLGSALLQLVTPPIPAAGFSPLDARVERLVNPTYRHSGRVAIRYAAVVVILAGAFVGLAPRGVAAVYGTHLSMSTEAHLTVCREQHEQMLQSQDKACGKLSTPQTCTTK